MLARILSLLLVYIASFAVAEDPYDHMVQTRNLDPFWVDPSPSEVAEQAGRYEPFRSRVVLDGADGYPEMVILMEEGLSDSIGLPLLQQWIDDIESEEYTAELVEISYAEPEEIRGFLDSLYHEGLRGAVLVGDLPAAWGAVWDTEIQMGEQMPCDYYLMDLDGDWQDLWVGYPRDSLPGQDGFYDTFEGEVDPEIWTGRIRVDNLSVLGDPVVMLRDYFTRNHEWRTSGDPEPVRALCYVDDDWQATGTVFQAAMQRLYESVELVNTSAETCADDYEGTRLPDTYSWISPHVHSNPTTHFWQPSAGTTTWDEIVPIAPPAHFYNLFACSNCRFTTDRYMGGIYAFASESGLAAVGSTTSGAMLKFVNFYGPLGGGGSLGEAWEYWWYCITIGGLSQSELNWHIGMVLLGDPSLVPSMHLTGIGEVGSVDPRLMLTVAPNPSPAPGPVVSFTLPEAGSVVAEVFDVSGRLLMVRTLQDQTTGTNLLEFETAQPGIYFVKVTAGSMTATERFVVLR